MTPSPSTVFAIPADTVALEPPPSQGDVRPLRRPAAGRTPLLAPIIDEVRLTALTARLGEEVMAEVLESYEVWLAGGGDGLRAALADDDTDGVLFHARALLGAATELGSPRLVQLSRLLIAEATRILEPVADLTAAHLDLDATLAATRAAVAVAARYCREAPTRRVRAVRA